MPKKSNYNNFSWNTPDDIQLHLRSRWDKGAFFLAEGSSIFPLYFPIKGPSANEITEFYADVIKWVSEYNYLIDLPCVDVIWEERNHRLSGKNQLPVQLCFENAADLAYFVGRFEVWNHWNTALEMVHTHLPELMPYWIKNAGKCLIFVYDLPKLQKLLNVCRWCRSYIHEQKERIYIRQIPLEGIHTKFVEANKSILAAWLDFLCPEELVNSEYTKGTEFAKRYGFLDRPQLVRIRILDSNYYLQGLSDLTLVAEELAQLDLGIHNVFICENNVTCLSFPPVPDSILIFGAGYGFDALSKIPWLHLKRIFYWGDLDTNGFCILDQLKSHFPHVQSFLMDENTLETNKDFWGREDSPCCRKLTNLNQAEYETYQGLCNQNWGDHVRLEQELIPISSVKTFLSDQGFIL